MREVAAPTARCPRVVARRWDQLGGRLGAIVNAASLASLFQLDYGFVWPRGRDDSVVTHPEEIFSRHYLQAHELEAGALEDRSLIHDHELLALEESAAHRRLADDPRSFVDVHDPFDIARTAWEEAEAARARFARSWAGLGWSEDVRELMHRCADAGGDQEVAALHVRAGDIVDGDWRQVMVHEKYLPTPFVEHAIQTLAHQRGSVLILSDNREYLMSLRERFPATVTAADLVPGYADLSQVHQALADIFLLSGCREIVGPPSSAFSRLAANVGPGRVIRADELVPAGCERESLLAGVVERRPQAGRSVGRLLARDICWCLDVFGDELSLDERLGLARDAVQLDGDFSGGAARLARLAALAGDMRAAQAAAARAISLAEPVDWCADALLEALATDVVVGCFTALRFRTRSAVRWLPSALGTRRQAAVVLARIEQSFERCLTLQPFWCIRERVWADLRAMIRIVRWGIDQPPLLRLRLASAVSGIPALPGPEPARFSNLEEHRCKPMYDPLTRDLDRIVWHLNAALAPLMAESDA